MGKPGLPLVVDLDGTIIKCDLLFVSLMNLIKSSPGLVFAVPFWLVQGKSVLKDQLAKRVNIDVSSLPYDDEVIAWLREEKKRDRVIILSTASNKKYAYQVAGYLDIFDSVQASDRNVNLSSYTKKNYNVELFGEEGFDYVGNSMDDIPIWEVAANAILVNPSRRVLKKAREKASILKIFR